MRTSEIRTRFLEYFAERGHQVVESAPLVPRDDPTLLFVNAGMVPFKDQFTGSAPRAVSRAASAQRCLRVSGKHNDLEEVGRTPRHHTLFEMLGNFSFGDYFKEGAISFAWEFLVDVLGVDPKRLKFTVFGGGDGIPADDEARRIWKSVARVDDSRILSFGMKDNFWAMGETGPCGPCSEIHYDLGVDLEGEVNSGARWMEIWNLVFMQYERSSSGKLAELPSPAIDTGMGLERIASVVQGKRSNYDIDLFGAILSRVSSIVGRPYEGGDSTDSVSMRVIADHARATAFLLADGVHPDKTGRGYVLRKIMRRAVSHGVLLGVEKPFLAEASSAVADAMGDALPLLKERWNTIREGAEAEEELFRRTVEHGIRRIDELLESLEDESVWTVRSDGTRVLSGETAFRLYDTWGTPLELTSSLGVRRGFEVDEEGFFRAMELQKERSRASWKGGAGGGAALDSLVKEAKGELPRTTFTGYEACEGESRVCLLALVGEGGLSGTTRAGEGSLVALAMSSTPFYGESGGQVGDAGVIESAGARVRVEDTQRARGGEVLVHFGTVEEGELAQGDAVRQRVDAERRSRIMSHHSGTHLVHHALREILGVHVQQKGSFVGPDHLRFDFSHPRSVGRDELTAIEARVNELVRANHEVVTEVLPYKTAIERGALAFFGDKYGDEVRMVTMGPSKELCGGTHVVRTGNLGFFTFSHEGSVASGVRRIEALAGIPAESKLRDLRERLESVASVLRSGPDDVAEKLLDLTEEVKRLKRKIAELERESASAARASLASSAKNVAGHRVIVGAPNVDTREALRELGDLLRASGKATVVVLGAEMEGKVALVAAVSDDVVKKGILRAGDLVGRVAKVAGGGGGGSPHLATAGAKDPSKLSEALEAVPSIVGEILS